MLSCQAPPLHPLPGIRFINANPKSSKWFNRDRFVLSNGYGLFLFDTSRGCLTIVILSPVTRKAYSLLDSYKLILDSCALLYIALHLAGYKLSLDDLKAFRQIDSLTPGHPEAGHTDGQEHCLLSWIASLFLVYISGIEVTTGPLGQGISNAVGLAIAQAHLGAVYNRDGFDLLNNYTYGWRLPNKRMDFH